MRKNIFLFAFFVTVASYAQTLGAGVTDIDGNTYNTVIIGAQEWQKENLNVSKYSDGTIIPQVTDPVAWANLTTGAWCYYNNDAANGAIYGKLYNWYAVAGIYDAASLANPLLRKQLAPIGWHVPSDTEWTTLIQFIDPNAYATNNSTGAQSLTAGIKMKEAGNNHWFYQPGVTTTNESGFTGLPGGQRGLIWLPDGSLAGSFDYNSRNGMWWSSTYSNLPLWPDNSYARSLSFFGSTVQRFDVNGKDGFSVRLIKNSSLNNQSFQDNSFKIYPNPAKDQITIDFGDLTNASSLSYKIMNTLGQEVTNGKINFQQSVVQFNSLFSKGIYFIKIIDSSNNVIGIRKIIVNN